MSMHEGGCLCGAVRYRVKNPPLQTSACHCTACQRRTGSAFGVGGYFKDGDVEMLRGTLKSYEHRSDETQRWLRFQFCPECGTTVTWTIEARPGMRAIGLGTFDDPKWLKVDRFGWFRSAQPWVIAPPGVEVFEKGAMQSPRTA